MRCISLADPLDPFRKRFLYLFLAVAGLFSAAVPAAAYVLQCPQVLDLMAKKLDNAGGAVISQKILIHDWQVDGPSVELDETLHYLFPRHFRSDIRSQTAERSHVVSDGEAITVIDSQLADGVEGRFDRYKDLLLNNTRQLLEARLSALGVDLTVSSLGRINGQFAFVLGARYPDESVPQVWIEKETFRPLRWIVNGRSSENGSGMLEIRYLDWGQVEKISYPMIIEYYLNDVLVREIHVESIRAVPDLPADLFDIHRIRETLLSAGTSSASPQPVGEVQQTIDDFKKMFQ
jgi:hypothetical protein